MGRRRKGRGVTGVLLLDKPPGISSNHALQRVRRIYEAARAGHTGSLDVPATGLLPICLGEATKLSGYLLDAPKAYRAGIRFGVTTTTGDAAGEILERAPVSDIDAAALQERLQDFTGPLQQVPPMYSAIKVNGERLYKLAYRGEEVARAPRAVTVYEFKLLDWPRQTRWWTCAVPRGRISVNSRWMSVTRSAAAPTWCHCGVPG